ncbi:MAG: DUF1446 domain-containing protein, partial [Gammaproteobacteria bacterium]|nr:DUF1446 domain-containing protein [Gammaproteobacteria bacterium]
MSKSVIKIGGASGYWGDASSATPQLLASGTLDYLVYDYLAEITMSIMARARAADNSKGYATDFVYSTLKPNLVEIATQGVKVIANAGGVNPQACAREVEKLIATENLDLKVAVVLGDDLLEKKTAFASAGIREMYSDQSFPDENSIVSINAYLGAFPIAKALDAGADIVITGRCVDSAVTLGACIHEFGWGENDFDKLAQGSLAGHILECGTQVTGGNFTDWETVVDSMSDAGYPIAEISVDGSFITTKPEGTGGVVSVGTVAEQMLYEIGDPQAYVLPDVVCDFSEVKIEQKEKNRVKVYGGQGHGRPEQYKVSATYTDGFRSGQITTFYGRAADIKAEHFAKNVLKRTRQSLAQKGLPELTEACVEVIGAESHYGTAKKIQNPREVDLKLAVKHPDAKGIGVFLKELAGAYLSGPPGLTGFAGARPKPSPVVRLFSFLLPKNEIEHSVEIAGKSISLKPANLDTR